MKLTLTVLTGVLVLVLQVAAPATSVSSRVTVMTRNLFIGSDLTPVIVSTTPVEFIAAVNAVLQQIAANDFPERSRAIAREIADKRPHLVGLQEVSRLTLNGTTGALPYRDHLDDLLDALAAQGADYYVAGVVRNLDVAIPVPGLGLVRATDRDVVLARADVPAAPVALPGCRVSADGCNYQAFAALNTPGGTINNERGFVVVDAIVGSQPVRFVNTHLEVPELPRIIQALQASELIARLNASGSLAGPTVIAGDINSAPTEGDVITGAGVVPSAYRQFLLAGYADTWNLRPGSAPGLTCCQANDLLNTDSQLVKRVDTIFVRHAPAETHANLTGVDPQDRTPSGLWPSDHAGVVVRLLFPE